MTTQTSTNALLTSAQPDSLENTTFTRAQMEGMNSKMPGNLETRGRVIRAEAGLIDGKPFSLLADDSIAIKMFMMRR